MQNPFKKITFKSKKKELSETLYSLSELIGSLVAEGEALEKKRHDLDIRCQSLELTVREQQKKIKELEKVAFESKQKAVKLQQELHEANLKAALYERMADRAIREKVQLKRKYCTPCTEGAGKQADKEVTEDGKSCSV